MRFKMMILLAAFVAAPSSMHASQPPDEAPQTPCEEAGTAIANHATQYIKSADKALDPLEQVQDIGKACGVLLRGIAELRQMSCPQHVVDGIANGRTQVEELLDSLNEKYDYRVKCFVPDFL